MLNQLKTYYIGLPEWRHPDWYAEGKNPKAPLNIYAQHFSTVEGNTTFYALPDRQTVNNWNNAVPEGFRFCFKFPRAITHEAMLSHCTRDVTTYLQRLTPLENKLGILWLQMSNAFSPAYLPVLKRFLKQLPTDFNYGIEVRNVGFFGKDETEKQFNQLLAQQHVNRVMFDTRVLFANPAPDKDSQRACIEKPRLPLHVIATGDYPMLRFMSPMDINLSDAALEQWANKVVQWIEEGKTPYVFFHTPYKAPVPDLAQRFSVKLATRRADISPLELWERQPKQTTLF